MTPGLIDRRDTDRRFTAAALATGATYVVPALVDLRAQLLPASNQGDSSMCAAYAMAGWIEFYNWKYNGITQQVDPEPIYNRAKKLDGVPSVEGTTLECALQAAQDLGLISPVATASIRHVPLEGVQQALHRYGVILSAFSVTENWWRATPDGWILPGGLGMGGHAVIVIGYSTVDTPPWYAVQNSWGEKQGWRGFNRLTPDLFKQQFDYGLVWDYPV